MRRRPNPWIVVPAVVTGLIAGAVAWVVTSVSCSDDIAQGVGACPGLATGVSIVTFLAATIGMAVVVVLVFRSLAEYDEARSRGQEPPGPGCEV